MYINIYIYKNGNSHNSQISQVGLQGEPLAGAGLQSPGQPQPRPLKEHTLPYAPVSRRDRRVGSVREGAGGRTAAAGHSLTHSLTTHSKATDGTRGPASLFSAEDVSVQSGQIFQSMGLVSIDRSEAAALLSTTPRLRTRSSTNDFAPLRCMGWVSVRPTDPLVRAGAWP